ncbi:MAG: BamA/TamA family outer membrane protein [Candidatus Binatia bacterium]
MAAAHAEQDPIATERSLIDVIQAGRAEKAKAQGGEEKAEREKAEGEKAEEAPKKAEEGTPEKVEGATPEKPAGGAQQPPAAEPQKSWAILPQIGYTPEKGPNGGIKFKDRDISPLHLTLDLAASAALRGQFHLDTILISPSFFSDRLLMLAEGEYYADPTKEFFGLGNNNVGPDELSTNRYERFYGTLALGLRLSRRFAVVASGAYNQVQISHGHLEDDVPSTASLFPDLVGIHGGKTNPLSLSVLFNDRQEAARPTRGWSIIAKATWVPNGLGNDFHYTRYTLDGSYLYPLIWRRQVLGLHLGGQYIDTKRRRAPFYEFSSLGGSRDLRGYFEDRFLGTSNVVTNLEYRLKLLDFSFFKIWDIQIDGVVFGDAGRVFIGDEDIAVDLGQPVATIPPTNNDFRYSYGGGTRIALGEALVARIDVGFSDEEKGLVYLVFGHTF